MASLISTEKDYSEAIAASHLAVLHFLADWAPECSTITAVLAELAKDPGLSKAGLAKTRTFYQKPTGEGLTGYIRVLLGLMGKMGNMKLSY